MNLAVFGANGPTGRLLVAQALDAGHAVTAVTRHPTDFPLAHPRLRVVAADVYNFDSVSAAVEGQDAALSTLGVPYGRKPISVYSVGTTNIVRAMDAHGVRRLLAVSSSATDPQDRSRDTGGGFFFEKLLKPIITATLGRTLYADMRLMEEILAASDLDWTVVRPSGLFGTDAVTDYRTAPGFIKGRYTSRRDLAHSMLRELDERRFVRAPMAVATFSEQPTVLQLIRQEALSK